MGLVIGAGLSVLLLRVDTGPTPATTTVAAFEADPDQGGIADVIDGFPDGLVAAIRSDGQSLVLMVWPVHGEPFERTIPVGVSAPPDPVSFDVSGRRIATLLPVPDRELGVLYSGIPETAAIVATDVTGYAWHDSKAVQLAYTTYVEDDLLLWTVRHGQADPELITRAVDIQGHVAAWGEWGFAIQDDVRDNVILITETGEIEETHPGRVLDSHGTGGLAIDDDGISLLGAGEGVGGLDGGGLGAGVLAGRFSHDGKQLAVLTNDRVQVLSLEDDSEMLTFEGRPGVPQVTWSSDGRFVLYPAVIRGLEVLDTSTGEAETILTTRTLAGVGILPLSST